MSSLSTVARRFSGLRATSALSMIVLVGVASGFVMFSAAGARRTESSYDRFVAWSDPPTVVTGGAPYELGPSSDLIDEIAAFPGVEGWAKFEAVTAQGVELAPGQITSPPRLNVAADGRNNLSRPRGRIKVLEGHVPDDDSQHEVITDFTTADAFELEVGDDFTIVMDDGTRWPVELAGIVATTDSFPTIAGFAFSTVVLPRGFAEQHPDWLDPWGTGGAFWLRDGTAGIEPMIAQMDRVGIGELDLQVQAVQQDGAAKVVRLQSFGLWLAAGVAALTGLVVVAQVLGRQRSRAGHDLEIGRALGLGTRQAVAGIAIADSTIGLLGAFVGAVGAVALSPVTPFGLARNVEPDPGVRIDATVLIVGILATVVIVVAIGALCTFAALRRTSPSAMATAVTGSRIAGALNEPLATGWRIAFPRRRAALVALGPPILTVIALVVVATSLRDIASLPNKPQLTGGSWDAFVSVESDSGADTVARVLGEQSDVAGVARGGWDALSIAGHDVFTQILQPGGGVEPSVIRGRAPIGADEIALGSALLDELDTDVGSTVVVDLGDATGGGGTATLRVVGEVVLASPLFQTIPPDSGGLISDAGFEKWIGGYPLAFLVSFADGVTPQQGLDTALAAMPDGSASFAFARSARGDVVALDSMVALPWILVAFLAFLTIASLVQWSVVTSRRERRRTAVLRALGSTGSQIALAFVVAAMLIAIIAAAAGVGLGIALSRAVWRLIAEWLVIVPQSAMEWGIYVPVLAITIVTAAALAVWIGRRHAGLPGVELRVE